MFKIYGDATEFDQWAMDYALTNEHMAVGDKVLFRNASGEVCPMYAYDDGGVVVNVPNHLLQQARPIVVDLAGRPACRTTFNVIPHDKPEGYDDIYTESETHAPGDIESRVKALENGGGSGSGGGIPTAIIKQDGYDNALMGVAVAAGFDVPTTCTCTNMTYEEAKNIILSGQPLNVIAMTFEQNGSYTGFASEYYIAVVLYNSAEGSGIAIYGSDGPRFNWTSDSITMEEPK